MYARKIPFLEIINFNLNLLCCFIFFVVCNEIDSLSLFEDLCMLKLELLIEKKNRSKEIKNELSLKIQV